VSTEGLSEPTSELKSAVEMVLRVGTHPAKLARIPEVLDVFGRLYGLGRASSSSESAFATEALFASAIANLGTGPYGQAARLLFGIDDESRGLPLKTRRRLAAEELGVYPSTFRKLYEDSLLDDLVFELVRSTWQRRANG
jgi:hypothetical protein